MDRKKIRIEKIINGGYGLSHLDSGQIILVRNGLPEESAIVTIEKTKKNYLLGKIEKVLEESPGRRPPPCPHYGVCGGCDLQHCDYSSQCSLKKEILEDLVARQKLTQIFASKHFPLPQPSPREFNYRQRIRLQVSDECELGFHRHQSHAVIPVRVCMLAAEEINLTLSALQEHDTVTQLLSLSTELELLLDPSSGKCSALFHLTRKPRPADRHTAQALCRAIDSLERVFFTGADFPLSKPLGARKDLDLTDSLSISYQLGDEPELFRFSWEIGGFCQVNLAQNRQMINTVLEFCAPTRTDRILDLFCGMGNFSLALARQASNVLGIEGQGSAIRSARYNSRINRIENAEFVKSPVEKACYNLAQDGHRFETVVIDPPRQGAPQLARQLAELCTRRLIYISCDPATLCRDLKDLDAEGFSVRDIRLFDMFPQTHHLESVVHLEKR